jgi:hypothetical protein
MEAVTAWDALPPGEKQESDDSIEAHRTRSLILSASDSTIGQTTALRSNMLAMAQDTRADEHDRAMEALIEERRQKAILEIARMEREAPRLAAKDNT